MGKPCRGDAAAQLSELLLRNIDPERADGCCFGGNGNDGTPRLADGTKPRLLSARRAREHPGSLPGLGAGLLPSRSGSTSRRRARRPAARVRAPSRRLFRPGSPESRGAKRKGKRSRVKSTLACRAGACVGRPAEWIPECNSPGVARRTGPPIGGPVRGCLLGGERLVVAAPAAFLGASVVAGARHGV